MAGGVTRLGGLTDSGGVPQSVWAGANLVAGSTADNLPVLKGAIAEAVASGLNELFVPPGTYYFVAKISLTDRVVVPANFRLYGVPGATIFKIATSSYSGLSSGQQVGILVMSDGSSVSGIVFDGQKSLVNGGAITNYGGNFISRVNHNVSDVIISDVECKNNPGGSAYESFCIQTGFYSKRWKFIRVWCHDTNGTGISINGDMMQEYASAGTGLASDMDVIDCRGTDNYWQGVTIYGARNVRVRNFVGTGNGNSAIFGGNGINLEWVTNVTIHGGMVENNKGCGIGGFGTCEKVYVGGGLVSRNNNTLDQSDLAEIGFKVGSWYTGPGGTAFRGVLQSIYIEDVSVTPKTTGNQKAHFMAPIDYTTNWVFGVATGGSYPTTVGTHPIDIVIRARDADSWVIGETGTGITNFKAMDASCAHISYPDVGHFAPNWAPPIGSWTSSTMTAALLVGGFNGARYRLTSNSAAGTFATAGVNLLCPRYLPANRKFLIKVRFRNNNADPGWNLAIRPAGYNSGSGLGQYNLNLYALDTNWHTAEMIVSMPITSTEKPRIFYCGSNASATLDIELAILPLASGSVQQQSVVIGGVKTTYLVSGSPLDEDFEIGERIFVPGADLQVTAAGSYGALGATTLTISSGQNQGTLSQADETFRPGKWITVTGAGSGGVDKNMLIRYVTGTTISFTSSANTSVTNASCAILNPTTSAA